MPRTPRQTRSYLQKLFSRHGIHPRRDLGQNFLVDLNLLEFIVEHAELGTGDVVLEVGAGTGGLTARLAERAGTVVSVEVDRRLHRLAREAVEPFDNVTLLQTDVLKGKHRFAPELLQTLHAELRESPGRRLKLVSNLPYNVATPVISNLVAADLPWERMLVTIQWELARRMVARPGTRDYGAFSVWLQSQGRVEILRKLGPTVFWPRPEVHSAVVRVLPDPQRQNTIQDRGFFQEFLRQLFTQRRKHLRRGLAGMDRAKLPKPRIDAILAEMSLPASVRAEELDAATLVDLSNRIQNALKNP